ncbi:GSCFA family protein [Pseudovibrio axinellae]|uniref:GSCFA family protein n=1 Tax=Pseudovibrio axinellae TaxID=989403 RepID=A0A165SVN2_9HYPH|nr:GSCFA family protein [Pseudovibrio axinellae]SEQ74154.1 GSCFA family protein [Pseudovibrio axinellae]
MPLQVLSSQDAIKIRKQNLYSNWPNRGKTNRFEPVARPKIEAGFKIEPGSTIFTVGSCFARNVEANLVAEGFRLPVRELLRRPEFDNVTMASLNNYGAPSIFNEFCWALDSDKPFDPDTGICQVKDDRYVDLHVMNEVRPAALEEVTSRREAITELYRSVRESRTVIITLGLSEVWFDQVAGNYLNVIPLPGVMRQAPDRFELHILTAGELLGYLTRTVDLINQNSVVGANILISISPVPLNQTFRDLDVSVANTYSKSSLRAAAEELVYAYDNVFYYPSYEAITLSDRKLAWQDDQVHVTDALVSEQVSRMVGAYTYRSGGEHSRDTLIESLRGGPSEQELDWLSLRYADMIKADSELSTEYAHLLIKYKRFEEALSVLEAMLVDASTIVLKVRALKLLERFEEAEALVATNLDNRSRNHQLWEEAISLSVDQGKFEEAHGRIDTWRHLAPSATGLIFRRGARIFAGYDTKVAIDLYARALEFDPDDKYALVAIQKLKEIEKLKEAERLKETEKPKEDEVFGTLEREASSPELNSKAHSQKLGSVLFDRMKAWWAPHHERG